VRRALGFCSRTGSAEAVAVDVRAGAVALVGRWSVDLLDGRAPGQVFHVAQPLPAGRAEALVRRTIETVTAIATGRLDELLRGIGGVAAVAVVVGDFPVPDALPKILASHALMHAAEGRLYRDALLDAAAACGVRGVEVPRTLAAGRLVGDLAAHVATLGVSAGRPWRKEHKLAAVAALAAGFE
jgi:hypothetical protein